jgi:cobaltochelatase CobN
VKRRGLALFGLLFVAVALGIALHLRSAARKGPAEVVALGIWDQVVPSLTRLAQEKGMRLRVIPLAELERADLPKVAAGARVALVLNAPAEGLAGFTAGITALHDGGTRVLALDQRPWQGALVQAGVIEVDPELGRYWRFSGDANLARMLDYLAVRCLGEHRKVEPPSPAPPDGFYHPDAAKVFPTLAEYTGWYAASGRVPPDAPKVAYVVHGSFLLLHDTAAIDAVVRTFERHGLGMYTVFADSELGLRTKVLEVQPALLMTQRHTGLGRPADGSAPLPLRLGVPYLKPINAVHTSVGQWQADPQGLRPGDLAGQMVAQELEGTIEPLVVSGVATAGESRLQEPIPERIERLATRARAWLALARTPAADKRLAIVYFNAELGGSSVGQGSASGMFLDTPESLVRVSRALRERGYAVEPPADAASLVTRLKAEGRNYGPWAQADIDALAQRDGAVLVSARDYRTWFDKYLTESARRAVIAAHGEPPGKLMVTSLHGEAEIVLPRVSLGPHVSLFPQPEKGARQDARLVHDQSVPPSHQYIAFYLWLQEVYRPHAVVHFGTHGTLELLPRRAAGLGPDDFADALLGAMPNLNPWILDNVGEATLARRRAYALLVDHLTPPLEGVEPNKAIVSLHEETERALGLEAGPVREASRVRVVAAMRATAFALDLLGDKGTLSDEALKELDLRLHALEGERAPRSLHVLGQPPSDALRPAFVSSILGHAFVEHAGGRTKAEALARCATVEQRAPEECAPGGDKETLERLGSARRLDADLLRTPDEVGHLLDALEGKYVPPGPGNDPVRNPAALPTGRNLYALDPEQVPSAPAFDVARQVVAEMLAAHEKKHGRPPRKIAINLNGFETMRDTGVTEAQALVLVGAEPVRDARGVVSSARLVPREALGRPRVDVVLAISGTYRDNFPTRVRLLDRALRLAQESPEPDNPLAQGTREARAKLEKQGASAEQAARWSRQRIFGQPPGQYGTQLLYLLPRSGSWQDRAEVAEVYRENMRYAYGEDAWGEQADQSYAAALANTDAVAHVWASTMMSPLTNHHVYEYLGGLSMAVEQVSGKRPDAIVADVRDPSRARARDLAEVVSAEGATRLLNERWIREMQASGYAGAGHVSAYAENLFGWASTVPGSVSEDTFARLDETYLQDKGKLGTRKWMEDAGPEALRSLTVTLLEAARRGYWKPSEAAKSRLVGDYVDQVARRGPPSGMMGGGNAALAAYVRQAYEAPGSSVPRASVAAYEARLGKAEGAREAAAKALETGLRKATEAATAARVPEVSGVKMRPTPASKAVASRPVWAVALAALGIVATAFVVGLLRSRPRRRGTP